MRKSTILKQIQELATQISVNSWASFDDPNQRIIIALDLISAQLGCLAQIMLEISQKEVVMRPNEILALSDLELAEMYANWSEAFYCAGWLSDGEEDFVECLLGSDKKVKSIRTLEPYELETVKKIRALVKAKEERTDG